MSDRHVAANERRLNQGAARELTLVALLDRWAQALSLIVFVAPFPFTLAMPVLRETEAGYIWRVPTT